MAKLTGIRLPSKYRRNQLGGGRLMRSDNLRAAPQWITPETVGRILALSMPIGGEQVPVATVPTRGAKPVLALVKSGLQNDTNDTANVPATHSRHAEESEVAAIVAPQAAASPPRDECFAFRTRPAQAPDWSADEDDRLREAYGSGGRIDLLAEQLGRTEKAAYSRAKKIGLTHPREIKGGWCTAPSWSAAEDELLRGLYGEIPTKELPARLGRSRTAIFNRAHALGLQHGYHRQFTRSELKALKIGHERGLAIADLAAAMGRKAFSLSKYATNHGIRFGLRPRLAEPITLQDILALEDPAIPPPAFRNRREREAKLASERRAQRAGAAAERQAARDQAKLERRAQRAAARAASKIKPLREAEKLTGHQVLRQAPSREPAPLSPARAHSSSDRAHIDRANKRRGDAVRQRNISRAEELIDAGKPAHRSMGVHIVMAVRAVEAQRAEHARLCCPVEQAKRILQRRYAPVCSMAVYGGNSDHYIVGQRKNVTREQLLAMAKKAAA